jgi:hypothetical protein
MAAHTQTQPQAQAQATISAEPELRNFKKESTSFVPASMRRKKAAGAAGASGTGAGSGQGKVNAAPSVGSDDSNGGEGQQREQRPDLVSALKGQFGDASGRQKEKEKAKPKGDYEKFVEEMGDILGGS